MALRIRRGTDLERIGIVFVEGELVYSTDTKRLYIGDGVTAGGVSVSDLINDTSPQLGADIDLNGQDIVGFGNINISGDITATGTLTIPTIITDVQGSIFGDDSQPLVDGANSKLVLDNNVLNDISDVSITNPVSGEFLSWNGNNWINSGLGGSLSVNITGNLTGDVVGNVAGNVAGNLNGDVTGNVAGDVVGDVIGDLNGSVYSTDGSTVLINGDTGTFYGDLTGSVLGDLTGSVLGDLTGNVLGDVVGNLNGSVYSTDGSTLLVNSDLATFYGDFIGGVTGNVTGNLTGDVIGDIVGSVYSIDGSTLLLDASTRIFTGSVADLNGTVIVDSNLNLVVGDIGNTLVTTERVSVRRSTEPELALFREDDSITFNGSNERIGSIQFNTTSALDTPNTTYSSIIIGNIHKLMIGHGYNNGSIGSDYLTIESGKLHIGSNLQPTERLEVEGNTKVNGFVQFGSYTTVERDDLTTTNNPQYATNYGMVIYNTTTNTFQGWANVGGNTPTWVDLS